MKYTESLKMVKCPGKGIHKTLSDDLIKLTAIHLAKEKVLNLLKNKNIPCKGKIRLWWAIYVQVWFVILHFEW